MNYTFADSTTVTKCVCDPYIYSNELKMAMGVYLILLTIYTVSKPYMMSYAEKNKEKVIIDLYSWYEFILFVLPFGIMGKMFY